MRAATIRDFGAPECIEIEDRPIPTPTDDDILLAVHFAAANHVDTFVRSGRWRTPLAFPFTVGRDAVGRVAGVGAAVTGVEIGQWVWCNSLGHDGRDGATAEFVVAPQAHVYPLPTGIEPAEMIALAHPAATACLALFRHGRLTESAAVLVEGAAGNIGSAACLLARAAGAEVVATCHSRDREYVTGLGAHRVLDYGDIAELVETLGEESVDLVVDTSGRNELERSVRLLRRGGRVVLIAGLSSTPALPVGAVYLKNLSITGFAISYATTEELAWTADCVNDAVSRLGLRPRAVHVLPFEDIAAAHRMLEDGTDAPGKLVIDVAGHGRANRDPRLPTVHDPRRT